MKKILNIAVALLMGVVAVVSIAGCGKKKLSNIYNVEDTTVSTVTTAKKLDNLSGYYYSGAEEALYLFEKTEDGKDLYKVYNAAKDKVVFSYNETDEESGSINLYSCNDNAFFVLSVIDETSFAVKTHLYDATGRKIVTKEDAVAVSVSMDVIKFDSDYCRMSDKGEITALSSRSKLSKVDISKFTHRTSKYYYYEETNSGVKYVNIFDLNLGLVGRYSFPSYAEEVKWVVLENGKILVQYVVEQDQFSSDYMYVSGGNRYKIFTKVITPDTLEEKKIKDDIFIIGGIGYGVKINNGFEYEDSGYNKDLKNVVGAVKVSDKKLDMTKTVVFSFDGSSKFTELEDVLPGQTGVTPLYNGYFSVGNALGQRFLFNKNSKLIGEITENVGFTANLIVGDEEIYDYDLKSALKYKDLGYTFERALNEGVILSKTDETDTYYYLFALSQESPALINGTLNSEYVIAGGNSYFYIVKITSAESEISYNYYNAKGNLIGSYAFNLTVVDSADDYIICRGTTVEGDPVYYRFS